MKKKYNCINCNKEVSDYRVQRCSSCENKRRFKNKTYEEIMGIQKAKKIKELRKKVMLGKQKSIQHCKNLSKAHKGLSSPFKNKTHTKSAKRKISLGHGGTGIPYEFSKYPLEFDNFLKEQIRKRDNYICQKCGITEEEHLIVYGKVLCIHHIDYNKKNCKEKNLITLCNECNKRVNKNRNHWIDYFNTKLKKEVILC